MSKYDLTVAITVHTEGLLAHKTMRSVFRSLKKLQEFRKSYEIVVNIDNGDKITKDYFKRYKGQDAVRVFENTFGDAGPSRNFLVQKSRGHFVAFVDGDDLVSENWFIEALKILDKEEKETIVFPEAVLTFGTTVKRNVLMLQQNSLDLNDETVLMFGENQRASAMMAKKEVFLMYPYRKIGEGYGHEDYVFNIETLTGGLKHKIAPGTMLFYRRREKSRLSQAGEQKKVLPMVEMFDFKKMQEIPLQEQTIGNAQKISYKIYKKIRNNESINRFITPVARVIKDSINMREDGKQRLPNFVINEWTNINAIDPELCPFELKVRSVDYYDPRKFARLGRVYCELAHKVTNRPNYVFIVPWLKRGGADKVIISYTKALKEAHPDWHFAVVTTLVNENVWSKNLPKGVDVLDFGNVSEGLSDFEKEILFSRLVTQLQCPNLHIMNSEFGYEWVREHKALFKKDFRVNVSIFCTESVLGTDYKAFFSFEAPLLFNIMDVVNKVFTDNQAIIDKMIERNAFEADKFKVHYQPVENVVMKEPKKDLAEKGRLNILWASRVVAVKLPQIVAEIGKKLDSEKCRIHIYGEMSHEVNRNIFDDIPAVEYHGIYDGFGSLPIEKYDVLLYTAYDDGLPNVLLESAAMGLPIIASNDGGVGEFVKDGETGILVRNYMKPDEYVQKINQVIQEPEKLVKYAENAQKLIKKQHDWEKFVKMVEKDFR